ncbi:GAF and ANTAR domain-containing protein [Streptomyces sp. NPDC102365]|uniref:GAF and ANTAR domain-containing protein n=1 Tax=Streptomyces sp. NPDC102365 TaxID=3366162 RepID=UPI0037F2CFED
MSEHVNRDDDIAGEARMNRERERELARTFVDLADTYAPDFDPLRLFDRLVRACRSLLDIDAAAVMIADARGVLKTMAATEDEAVFIELMQMQTGRGPCMHCYRTGESVSVRDIRTEADRWPALAGAMAEAGYRSLHAVPVRLHERGLGALTLLNARPGDLSGGDLNLAQSLADSAALGLMHWSAEPRGDDVVTRVQSAMAVKTVLEIATGMISAYHRVPMNTAGRLLAGYADRRRVSLSATARALVDQDMQPADVLEGTAGS